MNGNVLWWDNKDKNGIIVDAAVNEFYFDISVLKDRDDSNIKSGVGVTFQQNTKIKHVACACVVKPLDSTIVT